MTTTDTPEQAANMRTRSDLARRIVDTIKDKGWTQEEAAKQSSIANSRMHTLLSGNMGGFSADELRAIAEALQAKDKFIYLNEVGKNLALLYQYSDVAASIRAFGGTDQDCVSFAGSDFKRDYGDDLTLQAVNELCIFNLSELMFDFLNNGKEHLINRVLDSPDFCAEVIKVFYTLSKIPLEERLEAEKKRDDARRQQQKTNAQKPRNKTDNGEISKECARALFKKWSATPDTYKNKAAFNADVVSKDWCKTVDTANKWLNEFIKTEVMSDELKNKIVKVKK